MATPMQRKSYALLSLLALAAAVATHVDAARLDPRSQALHLFSSAAAPSAAAAPEPALAHLMQVAASSLQSTYTWINPNNPQFPDVVDPATGRWHADDIDANGAAGLFAGSLWSMHKLTGSDVWRARALTASAALRDAVTADMGQAMGTLAYPALRYAYEAEEDEDEKELYREAALQAAYSVSTLFVRVPAVLKVRPTEAIAAEARAALGAAVSPLAAFSSVEGVAAATGLLVWAATLPGGRTAWRDMALLNARRIVGDHLGADGLIKPTLVYNAASAREAPRPLAGRLGSAAADEAMEAWISSVGGQRSSPELRQALATLAMVEAARAAVTPGDVDLFTSAAAVTGEVLTTLALDPLAVDPAGAAATAAALAELSSLETLTATDRADYAITARHVIVTLSQHSLARQVRRERWASASSSAPRHHHHPRRWGASDATVFEFPEELNEQEEQEEMEGQSLARIAGGWLRRVLSVDGEEQGQQQQQQRKQRPAVVIPGITQARQRLLHGMAEEDGAAPATSSSLAALLFGAAWLTPCPRSGMSPAILTDAAGRGGSMLADHLLLAAVARLAGPQQQAR